MDPVGLAVWEAVKSADPTVGNVAVHTTVDLTVGLVVRQAVHDDLRRDREVSP